MAIQITCPGCRTRFQVSEKFAGQTGPCPKCKAPIRVPTKQEEVKIHAPEEFAGGGRSASGQLVTKPITRTYLQMNPVVAVGIAAAAVTVMAMTFVLGRAEVLASVWAQAIGLLVVSPPLVIAGYTFLHDEELEPHRGTMLYVRAGACAAAFVVLWGVFGYVSPLVLTGELWNWVFLAPPFLIVGALAALASLDLDFGNGVLLYAFYLFVTIFLRWVGGMGWVWQVNALGA